MNLLKRTFGFIWAVWGAFWFMFIITIFTFIYAIVFGIFGRRYSMQCVWINCHYLCPTLLALCLIRLRVFGRENITDKDTYVFVANHLTQIDIIASAGSVPQPVRFLAKSEIKFIPLFGFMTKMLAIMVDRKNKESREKSVQYMIAELQNGNSLFIYPEGTRNRTEQPLKDFKDGAFKVAIRGQKPIVVQTLVGAKAVNDAHGIQLYPGSIDVYFSKPIPTEGMTMDDMPALIEKVKAEMLSHLMPAL